MGDGDAAALEAFCRAEHGRLVGVLTLYVGDQGTAQELAQDAFARVCQHWPRVREMANPAAWLTRVALNLANSWFRRRAAERRAHGRLDQREEVAAGLDPPEAMDLREAVAALPPRQRQALLLRHYADLSVVEVADILGCAEGTVKALTHQARVAVRTRLAAPLSEEVCR